MPYSLSWQSSCLQKPQAAAVRTHPHENSILLQTENRQRISTLAVFLWARVDYASRAAKNSPPGCFCPFFCDGAAAVRIHPPSLREGYYKTETPVPGSDTGVLGGRGWITQAALLKTAHWAVFAPSSATGPQLFESTRLASGKVITKQKLQYPVRILEFLVGAGGFEPPKLKSSRFTVCPHWPLGNTPISYLQSSLTACIFYHLKWHLSTTFSTDFLFFCRSLFSCVLPQ